MTKQQPNWAYSFLIYLALTNWTAHTAHDSLEQTCALIFCDIAFNQEWLIIMKIFSPWVISLSMDVIALPTSFAREEYPFDKYYSGNYCGLEGELSDRSVEFWTRDCGVGFEPWYSCWLLIRHIQLVRYQFAPFPCSVYRFFLRSVLFSSWTLS